MNFLANDIHIKHVLFSVASLLDRDHFGLNLYVFLLFATGTNKIKYCFENSNKSILVAAILAGRLLEGQHTIFYFRANIH